MCRAEKAGHRKTSYDYEAIRSSGNTVQGTKRVQGTRNTVQGTKRVQGTRKRVQGTIRVQGTRDNHGSEALGSSGDIVQG